MELYILSLKDAQAHLPKVPTYAIRIISSFQQDLARPFLMEDAKKMRAIEHPLYVCQKMYAFDDIFRIYAEPNPFASVPEILFSEIHAKAIIEDFREAVNSIESLVVNCTHGLNRSPAVAIALNEIFELGHDTQELKAKYSKSNWHVYRTLLGYAKSHPEIVMP